MTVTIGFFALDNTGAVLTDSNGQPLYTSLPGIPDPYGFSSQATWAEHFTNGQTLSYVSYDPASQVLQAVYISGEIVNLPGIPVNVRTALFLARQPEKYLLELISTLVT